MSITILTSKKAHVFEKDAARELREFLRKLTREPVSGDEGGKADMVIAVGKEADKLIRSAPALAKTELQVKAFTVAGKTTVALRGGSPRAVRDAAYRFLEECGVLFDLQDDYLPDRADKLEVGECDIREKPLIPLHGPHLWINFPMDPSGYSREQWMRYVRGCARLRFTVLGFHFYNGFPWFDYELKGKRRQGGYFFYNHRHPLPEEPELRHAIQNRRMFVPPETEDFAENGPALHAWAQETLRLVMAEAHKFGLKTSVTFEPFAGQDKESQVEPAFLSLKAIIETYPDLDIVKLVSGEGHSKPGTDEALAAELRKFMGGSLAGTDGKETALPAGKKWWNNTSAIGVVLDTLLSAKFAYETVLRARKEKIIRPGMEVAIGGYPGCVDALPAIFSLIGRIVPDRKIKIHFLPAHGMKRTADAMAAADAAVFRDRRLEISGWTELDGVMYYPQSCIHAIEKMRDVLGRQPVDALYAIHWRVAGTTFSTAFFARSLWDRGLTPESFWRSQERLLGKDGAADMRRAHDALESHADQHGAGPAGFCYYRCWGANLPGKDGVIPWPFFGDNLAWMSVLAGLYERHANLAQAALKSASGASARRLAGYFANKVECARIHIEYCRLGQEMSTIGRTWKDPKAPGEHELWKTRQLGLAMVEKSREYLRHYQKWMFDRGDEGMLASYYMTATRYAWKYAYPDEDDASGRFCDVPQEECARLRAEAARKNAGAGDAAIHAPNI